MPALFSKLTKEKVHAYDLVLEATGIVHRVRSCGLFWCIEVPVDYRTAACLAISKYLKENPPDYSSTQFPPIPKGRKSYSAVLVVAPLVFIHWAVDSGDEMQAFVSSFGADAGRIVSGSLYRCLTALLLHLDWAHLLGNVAALVLFGSALAYSTGWGVAWLFVLLSGAGGNLLTAFWYGQGHVSVGASTAVFASVGLCAALSFWKGYRARTLSWRRWVPLAGGLALLAMLGAAPHTDLVAHMMGFIVGLATGLLLGFKRALAPWPVQLSSALLVAALVIGSWLWGLNYNG